MTQVHRVVVLGGGFGGVEVARRLLRAARGGGSAELEVHLVNRENYLVFQPMLPEVVSGGVGLADTISPLRRLLPGVKLYVREVQAVDLDRRTVTCAPGFEPKPLVLPFDHLVVALGNVTDFRGMTGLAEHALPFKTLGDALALRNHAIHALEEAAASPPGELRSQLLAFVVAGGGFSGVEAIAELHDFVRRALRSYPGIARDECRFVLLHARERILPEMDESLALYAQSLLQRRGVELLLGARLQAATRDHAILADGTRIPTRTLVATVPSHPNPVVESLPLAKQGGRILVDATLRAQGHDRVWALGDCALVPMPTRPGAEPSFAPPTAQHAIREGRLLADNLLAVLSGKPPRAFAFTGLGTMASLGHRKGVARVLGLRLSGFAAWWAWRTVYLMKLPGIDRKIRVGFAWALDLFFPPDLVQLRVGRSSGVDHEHFEPGQIVFEQGDVGDRLYIIVKGTADVVRARDGEGEELLATLGKGQYFGELALLQRTTRSATVRCREAMDVISVEKGDFLALLENLPEMLGDVEERLASYRQQPDPPA
ncbi:MAG TPA: FAD-dependent oxidoreductase [Thermoanaerobaculia bacterium]|nr:FAD-dependent oxidoreductase [Thermoanaerobaculia bacterium]